MPTIVTSSGEPRENQRRAQLTVFYGGLLEVVMRRTAELAAEAAESMLKSGLDGTVLYINTLTSQDALEDDLRKACRSRGGAQTRRRVLALTLPADDLVTHAPFIERTVETQAVRLVVLNSFEFAAMTPRRRMRLVAILQRLRDLCGVEIAVGLRREPLDEDRGAAGYLSYQATSITALADVTEFAVADLQVRTATPEAIAESPDWPEPGTAEIPQPAMQIGRLKTKDLAGVSETPTQFYRQAA